MTWIFRQVPDDVEVGTLVEGTHWNEAIMTAATVVMVKTPRLIQMIVLTVRWVIAVNRNVETHTDALMRLGVTMVTISVAFVNFVSVTISLGFM